MVSRKSVVSVKQKMATKEKTDRWYRQSEEFSAILDQTFQLHQTKGEDYSDGDDHYRNVRASAELGIDPWVGSFMRMCDKIQRIKSFIKNGSLKNESLEDSIKDIITYSAITLALYREDKQK